MKIGLILILTGKAALESSGHSVNPMEPTLRAQR
jgi:hypothetical protein